MSWRHVLSSPSFHLAVSLSRRPQRRDDWFPPLCRRFLFVQKALTTIGYLHGFPLVAQPPYRLLPLREWLVIEHPSLLLPFPSWIKRSLLRIRLFFIIALFPFKPVFTALEEDTSSQGQPAPSAEKAGQFLAV